MTPQQEEIEMQIYVIRSELNDILPRIKHLMRWAKTLEDLFEDSMGRNLPNHNPKYWINDNGQIESKDYWELEDGTMTDKNPLEES